MKRNCILLACLAFLATASCSRQKGYTLSVALEGIPDSTMLELVPISTHADMSALDTTLLIRGKAVFKGVLERPMSLGIRVIGIPGNIKVVMGNEKVAVKATAQKKSFDTGNKFIDFSNLHDTDLESFDAVCLQGCNGLICICRINDDGHENLRKKPAVSLDRRL